MTGSRARDQLAEEPRALPAGPSGTKSAPREAGSAGFTQGSWRAGKWNHLRVTD